MLLLPAIVLATVATHSMEECSDESGPVCIRNISRLTDNIAPVMMPRLNSVEGDTIRITPGQPLFLEPNVPNPFQERTTIGYTLDRETRVTLRVFDAFYNEIATLVDDEFQVEGHYEKVFDPERQLASGMYFYSLTTSAGIETRRMLLCR